MRFLIYSQINDEINLAIESGAVKATTLGHNKFSDRTDEEMGTSFNSFDETVKMTESSANDESLNLLQGYNDLINYCDTDHNACNPIQE